MIKNYVCYHLHSSDSLLDSATSYQEYIDYAASIGQTAIGFTEHGNLYEWYGKKQYAESKGLKYLHGVECYLTERFKDPNNKEDSNLRDNYHTILISKDWEGFVELNNLVKLSSQPDHRYYKWRLSFDEFLNISDHIIKISACVQSPLNKFRKNVKQRGITDADKIMMDKLLRHYDYYEIQPHLMEEQIEYNQYLYKMSKKYHKPLIMGTDTHSLNDYKAECRTILQYGKTDGAWGEEENRCNLTYQKFNGLCEMCKQQDALPMDIYLEAIEETNVMADSVEEIKIDTHNKYPILYGDKDEEMLWKTIKQNYKDKRKRGIISDDKQYIENIKEEMRVFKKVDMIGFMLFMSEIQSWAKSNHIATGFARGSVAGSTVAFITNITDVDPVKWNTVFSRFCNEHRVEAGDIDLDYYEDDRQKIYDYIINRFGQDKTAYVLAMGTLADKSVIDVIGKAYRVKAEKTGTTTEYTLDKIKEIKQEYDTDPEQTRQKYSDLFYYYDGLVNCKISQSQHPAGIIVSSLNLVDNYSGFYNAEGQIILPLDMDLCHDVGAIKYDVLGLKSVGVIDKTYKMLGKNFPNASEIDWNDQKVYEDIANDNTAIFQFESSYSGECLKKFRPHSIDELSLVNACIRPSGETYRDELLNRVIHKNPSKIIDDLLANDLGYLVYQESTIAFLQQICGFSGSAADSVRRAIGKKKEKEINEALPKILDGYCAKSDQPRKIAEQEAKEFLDVISSSSSYQFGRNHSISYSLLSYVMGYLRFYHPTEFCTAFLNCAKNDDDITNGTQLAINKGCTIVSPKFGFSKGEYTCDANTKTIYKGLSSIKYISNTLADELYQINKDKCKDFIDVLVALQQTSANSKQVEILITLNFFEDYGGIRKLLQQVALFNALYTKKQLKREKVEELGLPIFILEKHCGKITEKMYKDFDSLALLKDIVANTEFPHTSIYAQLMYQNNLLGYCVSTLPKLSGDIYFVMGITGTYKNMVSLYRICDGSIQSIKFSKAKNLVPLEANQVIRVDEYTERFRKKKVGEDAKGKPVFEDTDQKERVLSKYKVLT